MSDDNNSDTQVSKFTPIEKHLFESRTVFINGPVNGEMTIKVNAQLLALEKADADTPILLWINSPGGEVNSGFGIYDMIQFIKPKVIAVVAGAAASMGATILLAADKENRFAFPNAKILLHQPLIGGVIRGQASDIAIHAKDIIDLKKKMHRIYSERTGTDIEVYEKLMERDRWVAPEEAIELGLISSVINSREELDKKIKS